MRDSRSSSRHARFSDLVDIMARLRSPEGCPWDREQDHRSLRRCLLEEAYEVLEAIDRHDMTALREELGDLLLQVLFHAQLAAEANEFDITDVIQSLRDKLVARHPHVFGDTSVDTAEAVLEQWDTIKREELGQTHAEHTAAIPRSLPALLRAQKVQRQAARAGRRVSEDGAAGGVADALARVRERREGGAEGEEAVGALLFAAVELAAACGVDAEQALRERVDRFVEDVRGSAESGEREERGASSGRG